jgi:hypothetical protein
LLAVSRVDVTFGCWTSVSRKSVLPVFEEVNGLLFYPVQYEGEEESKNIFYTGAAPNQQAIPAVEYLLGPDAANASATRCWARTMSTITVMVRGKVALSDKTNEADLRKLLTV